MKFVLQNIVYVYYHGTGIKNLVGRLFYKNRKIFFEYDPAGEHSTMIIGEGKNPTKNHLLQLASIGNIKKRKSLRDHRSNYRIHSKMARICRKIWSFSFSNKTHWKNFTKYLSFKIKRL